MVVVSAAARARDFAFESPLNVVSSGHKLADSAVRATLDVGKSSPDSGCIVDGTQTYGKTHGVKVEVKDEVKVEVRANVPNDHSGVNVEANASAKPPKDGKAKDEIKGAARDVDIHAEVKPELGLTEEDGGVEVHVSVKGLPEVVGAGNDVGKRLWVLAARTPLWLSPKKLQFDYADCENPLEVEL